VTYPVVPEALFNDIKSGTNGSNPSPSSAWSANQRFRCREDPERLGARMAIDTLIEIAAGGKRPWTPERPSPSERQSSRMSRALRPCTCPAARFSTIR